MLYIYLLIAILAGTKGQDEIKKQQEVPTAEPKQQFAPYFGGFQHPAPLQYDISLLEPQIQLPGLGYPVQKQVYPRFQPQLLYYAGGAPPGQQFLLQPGAPPGNFLIPQPQPQPGPGVVLRDGPPRPIFAAGYPKPAHVPPIEKDAEEIPTDPARIPKFPSAKKPEKLETFNEKETPEATEQDILQASDKNPNLLLKNSLKPGQRFFVLNGQPLYPNYPFSPYSGKTEQADFAYQQPEQSLGQNQAPLEGYFLRNSVTGQISDVNTNYVPQSTPQNYVSLNQPQDYKEGGYIRTTAVFPQFHEGFSAYPYAKGTGALEFEKLEQLAGRNFENVPLNYFRYDTANTGVDNNDDTVVIDAKVQNDGAPNANSQASSTEETPAEPSISQAQPGAIALAGPGGVAAAAPRGTALVGEGGLAVSSPQATAVAGPSKEESGGEKAKANRNKVRKQ